MPIRWTISHEERLVVATTEGVVYPEGFEAYLDARSSPMPCRTPNCSMRATSIPGSAIDDVMMLGARMSAYVATLPRRAARLRGDEPAWRASSSTDFSISPPAAPGEHLPDRRRGAPLARRPAALGGRAIVLATACRPAAITASDRLYADALERRGFSVTGAPWDGPRAAFDGAEAVVIRSTWGYYRASDAFRDWTEAMAAATPPLQSHRRWCAGTCARITWQAGGSLRARAANALRRLRDRRRSSRCSPRPAGAVQWSSPSTGASGYSVELVDARRWSRIGVAACRRGARRAACWCRSSSPRSPRANCR